MNYKIFDKSIRIHTNLIKNTEGELTEKETKIDLILPLFQRLGYEVYYSKEFMSKVQADASNEESDRIDLVVALTGKPVMAIETKQFNTPLSANQIEKLLTYFKSSGIKLVILTNGDDYWFFADTEKEGTLDTRPYLKLKMSQLYDDEINKLYEYRKENIIRLDIKEYAKFNKFRAECKEFIKETKRKVAESNTLNNIANKCGVGAEDKLKLASILNEIIRREIDDTESAKQWLK